jgi:hypothetical protein
LKSRIFFKGDVLLISACYILAGYSAGRGIGISSFSAAVYSDHKEGGDYNCLEDAGTDFGVNGMRSVCPIVNTIPVSHPGDDIETLELLQFQVNSPENEHHSPKPTRPTMPNSFLQARHRSES